VLFRSWLSLQFDDGTDLMYYQLRRKDGAVDPHSRGAARFADGRRLDLDPRDLTLTPLEHWTSPQGRRWPIRWGLDLPGLGRRLQVRALLPNQLMDLSVRYWEGAVEILDAASGARLGSGYLEMTGY
jgi:predicted secreted hydrolase